MVLGLISYKTNGGTQIRSYFNAFILDVAQCQIDLCFAKRQIILQRLVC